MYKIVELVCISPMIPGQWTGRLEDGRKVQIRNDTFEATIHVETVHPETKELLFCDCLYRGMAVEDDRIAVSVICSNARVDLAIAGKVEGVA